MDKLISVIVPVYNGEHFIKNCIRSISSQLYSNIEILVINDGSTDNTSKKVLSLIEKDNRIKLYEQENLGVSAARNKGLSLAEGEYVIFVDSDDELLPNALEDLLSSAVSNDADIVCGNYYNDSFKKKEAVYKNEEALILCLEDKPEIYSSCAKLYRKEFIGEVRFVDGRKIHEDSFFVFQLCVKKPVFAVEKKEVYKCNATENSASRGRFDSKFLDILWFLEKKSEIIDADFKHLKEKFLNLRIKTNMALLYKMFTTPDLPCEYKNIEKECIKTVNKLKKHFIPVISIDKKMFFIITMHLYKPAKLIYKIKNRLF